MKWVLISVGLLLAVLALALWVYRRRVGAGLRAGEVMPYNELRKRMIAEAGSEEESRGEPPNRRGRDTRLPASELERMKASTASGSDQLSAQFDAHQRIVQSIREELHSIQEGQE